MFTIDAFVPVPIVVTLGVHGFHPRGIFIIIVSSPLGIMELWIGQQQCRGNTVGALKDVLQIHFRRKKRDGGYRLMVVDCLDAIRVVVVVVVVATSAAAVVVVVVVAASAAVVVVVVVFMNSVNVVVSVRLPLPASVLFYYRQRRQKGQLGYFRIVLLPVAAHDGHDQLRSRMQQLLRRTFKESPWLLLLVRQVRVHVDVDADTDDDFSAPKGNQEACLFLSVTIVIVVVVVWFRDFGSTLRSRRRVVVVVAVAAAAAAAAAAAVVVVVVETHPDRSNDNVSEIL
jgi:hypothetical protein